MRTWLSVDASSVTTLMGADAIEVRSRHRSTLNQKKVKLIYKLIYDDDEEFNRNRLRNFCGFAFTIDNSDEDIKLSESDCDKSEEKSDVIDNIPVYPDIYVVRDGAEVITHNSIVPSRFATAVVQQASRNVTPTSVFYDTKCKKI
ncbi:hypothetical protein TNCV_3858771 [Trichonephila clavipes]|nr:hypothetical protein TNCV_3858771 [Trichonephila clavipes]